MKLFLICIILTIFLQYSYGTGKGKKTNPGKQEGGKNQGKHQGSKNEDPEKNSGFVCPVDDIINTQCQGPKDCLYPYTDNCNQFIHCEVNAGGQTGRPTIKDCPAGLEWNDHEKICDWPHQSTCSK